jgi:hypothetical protein
MRASRKKPMLEKWKFYYFFHSNRSPSRLENKTIKAPIFWSQGSTLTNFVEIEMKTV